jgi:cell filamentation protein
VFCLPQYLESYAADVFGRLAAADRLRGLARDPFITGLAGFLADLNALHPFRESNGRAQRAFFSQLAMTLGITSPGVRMDPDRNMAASAAAHHGDLAPLRAMLDQLTDLPHPSGHHGRVRTRGHPQGSPSSTDQGVQPVLAR